MMKIIVEETNKYAESHPGFVRGHERKWTPVTVPELAVWVSLRIMMGISPKPRQAQHWSKDELHDSPFFYKHMPRDRYDQISTCLHFSSDGADQTNRLWKLGRIVELLKKSFKEAYIPPQTITVDESLWKFRGRLGFVTYNPTKRARFGLKIYKLCVSSGPTCGYTCNFNFYTGQDRGVLPASHKAVADLMESAEVLDKGYSLYVDNWYSSPTLFHWLQGRKTNACGTVRGNRKFMPTDFPQRLRQNDMERRSTSTGMLCIKWADKKQLYVLSTMHTSAMVETERVNRKGEKVIKPQAVIDYNEGMKGVDVGDQLASSYPAVRRSIKWYKKVFFYLFDMALINSFLLYKQAGGTIAQQLIFRQEVIRGLLSEYLPQAPVYSGRGRPASTNTSLRLQGRNAHAIVETEGKRYKRCHVCYTHGRRKMTKAECRVCRVPLCVFGCFEDFHNKLHY
ncbi:piggyBac transposable element-derived protein 4-like [Penaeus japonicus]|uniref:piggyBac transposable element-derived protein 4-like n=1 Tax=Penaeus japonicus TaxID=27405 RepID=UPI001C71129F|nr:piggyBac transposable element-derived protein 4-like [Penaeus japonicus]